MDLSPSSLTFPCAFFKVDVWHQSSVPDLLKFVSTASILVPEMSGSDSASASIVTAVEAYKPIWYRLEYHCVSHRVLFGQHEPLVTCGESIVSHNSAPPQAFE